MPETKNKIATREAYGRALVEFGATNDFYVLDADLSKSTMTTYFKNEYPRRHINMGIAEGNMMSVAAGIAAVGKTCFASTFAVFAAARGCEQIRNSICYPNLNVKIGATHAGISVGEDGASHQAIEDIAIMRAIPNMHVVQPCDAVSTRLAVKAALETDGPFYLRLGRLAVDEVYTEENCNFKLGKGIVLKNGFDLTIITSGLMVQESLKVAKSLEKKNISVRVVDMHTIKPIDEELIIQCAKETNRIVTVEESNIYGGLGSAVAEILCKYEPCKIKMIGIEDKFGRSGKPTELLEYYGLSAAKIESQIVDFLNDK
ncbi:transketolase family protein [Anaerobium acetethylicum]|uniref:Transketolase n=1 Tax=Anaerobium acetethylicum TaxID=1619234 RepID=A0A1D3TW53_9FIRM|nr:transketolase family protein [Anaerobium acetethylicum]SCP98413.1 transketolase [Anaerobium acetethylicum]